MAGAAQFKDLFANGATPLGMMMGSTDPSFIEITGYSGFDFVVLDNEHSPIDPSLMGNLVRAAEVSGQVPLIRLVENDAALISRALDAGAKGIVITHAESAADMEKALTATRFAPYGSRGWCPSTHTGRYSIGYWSRNSDQVTADVEIIPLIESRKGVENIDEILSVPGIRSAFFGPGDLSHELGSPWKKNAAGEPEGEIVDLMKIVIDACKRHDVKLIGFPFPEITYESAQRQVRDGFSAICFGMDYLIFSNFCEQTTARFGKKPRW